MSDYEELLDRAIEQIPPQARETKRFSVPKAYSIIQGNRTIIQNFGEVTDAMNRDPQHVLKFLLRELGTAGNLSLIHISFSWVSYPRIQFSIFLS